jgi:hypothetical protein
LTLFDAEVGRSGIQAQHDPTGGQADEIVAEEFASPIAIAIGILLLALSGAVLVVAKLPTSWSPATPGGEGGRW